MVIAYLCYLQTPINHISKCSGQNNLSNTALIFQASGYVFYEEMATNLMLTIA